MNLVYPPMHMPSADARLYKMNYFDGTARIVNANNHCHPYPKGKLIVSSTDLQGVITHANDAFVKISGYTRDEVIGMPHAVLRHPDMPRAVFAELWETIQAGNKWHGYVKNLCKDGGHYWVYATVVPNTRQGKTIGYTSVRREASQSAIDQATIAYKQMKEQE